MCHVYCPGDAHSIGSLVNEPVCAVVLLLDLIAQDLPQAPLTRRWLGFASASRLREEENGFIGGVFLFASAYSFICE